MRKIGHDGQLTGIRDVAKKNYNNRISSSLALRLTNSSHNSIQRYLKFCDEEEIVAQRRKGRQGSEK